MLKLDRFNALRSSVPRLPRPLRWAAALLLGSVLGLGLRVVLFFLATLVLPAVAAVVASLLERVPLADPVYTRAVLQSLGDVHVQGLAIAGEVGQHLHELLPWLVRRAQTDHIGLVRLVVQPGSALMARLVAAGLAHAALLTIGLLVMRAGWLRRSWSTVLFGLAMQAQVAFSILGQQPSVRELESTGLDFGANALLPWMWQRGHAVSDGLSSVPPPLLAASLVGLALVLAYLPASVVVVARARARVLTLGSALALVLTSSACAGVLQPQASLTAGASTASLTLSGSASQSLASASASQTTVSAGSREAAGSASAGGAPLVVQPLATAPLASDRWFDDPQPGPSTVQIVGSNYQYQFLVNGQPEVIKGMGMNTQYTQFMTPDQRAAQLESDMAALQQLGVNTLVGWDPNEFDEVLLDAAQRHGIGVIVPFDLNPDADYTDPALRQQLHDQVIAWVMRYRNHPALLMWGLGNEVLHKIVHPAWVGPQDPAHEQNAEAFSDWLIQTANDIHAIDPNHPVTYRMAEDAFVPWIATAVQHHGGIGPWFVLGTNCYQDYLSQIVDNWPNQGLNTALWVSEFAPGTMAMPDRPAGFSTMWGYIRRHPDYVLGGAVYAWTRNGPEGVDRNFGLTDDGAPVDGHSLDMLAQLFHTT